MGFCNVNLPETIQSAIDAMCTQWPGADLREAAQELMSTYREGGTAPKLDDAMVVAYLAIRAPATYAAASVVLSEAIRRIPALAPRTALDLGSGPGTVAWAVDELFPDLDSIRAVEYHPGFIKAGRSLAPRVEWLGGDLKSASVLPPADLVTASYSLGELAPAIRERVLGLAWEATAQALVVIEPGTPAGFKTLEAMRGQLLAEGATIAAPCPHELDCPLAAGPGWCHFSRRLARTRRHRLLKEGERGWEDEKFCFLVATRLEADRPGIRVLGHPQQSKVSVRFEACTAEGNFEGLEVPRRDKDSWKVARKLEWGDGF
jgi:ribosomal protein RSM22 (predicted rRNA methylase)